MNQQLGNPGGKPIVSVRFTLEADAADVCEAVARTLLFGQPPKLVPAGGWPMLAVAGGMLLPWPMSAEWQEATTSVACMMNPDAVFGSSQLINSRSFSMGFRPLGKNDRIASTMRRNGWSVHLEQGFPSNYFATETTPPVEEGSHRRLDRRSFLVMVSCCAVATAVANMELERVPQMANSVDLGMNSWVNFKIIVQPLGKGRTEVVRHFLDECPLVETGATCLTKGVSYWDEHKAIFYLRTVCFMMEMELRAWFECLKFPLVEVWRNARSSLDWAASGNNLTVCSYCFAIGHAAYTATEKKKPGFDMRLANRLSSEVPNELVKLGPQTGKEKQQFIEGNVQVESFAGLLDRVCRRAEPDSDIYRRFVDLGSGPGLAVLTAHLLFPFRSCVGVELQPKVAKTARDLVRFYTRRGLSARAESKVAPRDLLVEGDLLKDLDWADASVIFANAVTWPKEMIKEVALKALKLRPGAVFLLAARQLPCESPFLECFDVRGEACLMSFAAEAIFIWAYQRV